MLMIGETYNEFREHAVYSMAQSRRIIANFKEVRERYPDIEGIQDAIFAEQGWIMAELRSLKELERWRKLQNIGKDEPWMPESTPESAEATKRSQIDLSALWKV